MTNAAVTASSRAQEIFKRVSRGTHSRSRLRPPSKKISNVLHRTFLVRANAYRSRGRSVRHGAQRVVCSATSTQSLFSRISLQFRGQLSRCWIRVFRGEIWNICRFLCWVFFLIGCNIHISTIRCSRWVWTCSFRELVMSQACGKRMAKARKELTCKQNAKMWVCKRRQLVYK